ncbi:MAG TPA: N-6 DNA methylase [Verrucomicrobiae bacterium]
MENLAQFEADLWEAADNLRANSKLTSSDYLMPVLGVIFLRHAANRFDTATKQIADDQAAGRMPKRKVQPADYIRRRALWLPEPARYDYIMDKASVDPAGLPKLVTEAMTAIEADFEPLQGVLPKDYGIFEPKVLEDLMRLFNTELIKHATGDVFGRIYEYFLAKFSIQKAHDNGEFFTPSSLVQTIVNVIEPDHGIVFDPAIGSAGMAVQSSHFIEDHGGDTSRQVVIYGQEKNRDTIRIAKMNLAVHGLEGKIAEAITYYQDEHSLVGKCDFVMANPPFNVDLVDAERIAKDPRLPFGLPGVNKAKKVSNGNYLWISYFWSYLNPKGRAGFVMSSQASSAGNDEKEVRKKIVETGDVDVMVSIRGGFFYTRTVPCELWHFDRNKPADRKDKVLMLDARSIGQLMKGSRKVYEFTPEQLENIAAIVWLYRGQESRFVELLALYFFNLLEQMAPMAGHAEDFAGAFKRLSDELTAIALSAGAHGHDLDSPAEGPDDSPSPEVQWDEANTKLSEAWEPFRRAAAKAKPSGNAHLQRLGKLLEPFPEAVRCVIRQTDLLYKSGDRLVARVQEFQRSNGNRHGNSNGKGSAQPEARVFRSPGDEAVEINLGELRRLLKACDGARLKLAAQLKTVLYFHHQIRWLQDRFPDAIFRPVPGLCKIVTRKEIEAADWSLTPGRYVGVAPAEVDEDFDFEKVITDIHAELATLNEEADELASTIQTNFAGLTI